MMMMKVMMTVTMTMMTKTMMVMTGCSNSSCQINNILLVLTMFKSLK